MDRHVQAMSAVLTEAASETGGEIYDVLTVDDSGMTVASCPALKAQMEGRRVGILLFDVPGDRDHFSVVVDAEPQFGLTLRAEARWDFVLKSLKQVEDHLIGNDEFDRRYLIGGRPADAVIAFLRQAPNRSAVQALEPFLNLSFDDGFVRASFALTPSTHWTWPEVKARVQRVCALATAAEAPSRI